MRLIKPLVIVIVVVAVVAGGYWFYQANLAPKTAAKAATGFTQVVEVTKGNLSSTLSVVGELEALQQADLTFERMKGSAKMLTLQVSAGNTVTAGQVMATIDPAPYQQALDQASSDLQSAQEKLTKLKTPATALQLAKADLAVAQAEYNLQQAQETLKDLLVPDVAALESSVADAQSALAKAQGDLVALQNDTATADNVTKLRETENKASTEYARLSSFDYSDNAYQDSVQVSLNKLRNAQDARITAEVQQQVNILNAQIQVRKANQAVINAQNALATAKAGGDKAALSKAQLAVRNAEVSLSTAKDARTTLVQGSDVAIVAAAQADLDKKRLSLADATAALAGTKLTAPFAGTVLQTYVTPGNLVGGSTKIVTVANMKALQVVASVDETTIKRVSQGQIAQITFDALPGQVLRGQVGEVPLQGALQGGVMVYDVPLPVTGTERLPLLIGMTANVKIQSGQVQNALLVPAMAIQRTSGGYQVMIPNAADPKGAPVVVPVEIGLTDGVNTQIIRGLNLGDKVLVQMSSTQQNNNQRGGQPDIIFTTGADVGGPPPGMGR